MKKFTITLFSILFVLCVNAQPWTKEANYGGAARYYDVGFAIGNYGFVGCGNNGVTSYHDFYKWNQKTNTWSAIANYPGAGYDATPVAFAIEGKGYVGLGYGTGVANDLWSYDTGANTWTAMASLPSTGRYDESAFVLGHKAYIITGSTGGPPYSNEIWMYDAHKNSWTKMNNSPAGNEDGLAAFSIGNHGYIVGGWDGSSTHNGAWEYDSTNDGWTSIANLPVNTAGSGAFVMGSKAYLCTGAGASDLRYGYVYDTVTKAWSAFTNMGANGIERIKGVVLTIGNYGYIATGQDSTGKYLNDLWQYNPAADTLLTLSTIKALSNPKCNGDLTGSATVNVIKGFTPYTYSWNSVPVQATDTALGLSAGTYTVTVKDVHGNSLTASVTITQPSQLRDSIVSNTSTSATIGVKGGTAPYTYLWTPGGQTAATAVGLSAGKYFITTTDANGCSVIDSVIITSPTCDFWTKEANFTGAARYYDVGFAIGNYGFVGCGNNGVTAYHDFYKWNQKTNSWSAIANYPGAGYHSTPVAFAIEGKGYVGLGYGTGVANDLWSYDTGANTWTAMASLPSTGRYDESAFVLGHKAYVISGSTGGPPYTNEVWMYDAHKNSWTKMNNSPAGNTDGVIAFSIGNHGYIGGGWDGTSLHTACWEYDTTNDTWTSIASLPAPMGSKSAFVIGSKAYACTGNNGVKDVAYGYVYDTITKSWSAFTNMGANGIERNYSVILTIGNYGYIATGIDSTNKYLNDFWQFYPCSDTIISLYSINAVSDPKCNGDFTGSANVNVYGGYTPYTYSWNCSPVQTNATATGLSAGTYTVTVTDAHSKTVTASITITQPSQLRDSIVSSTSNSATVGAKGGTLPYNYSWNSAPIQTTATANSLSGGTYTVTVTDANGCAVTASATTSSLDSVHICIVSVDTSSLHNIIVWNNSGWINIDSVKIYFLNSSSQWQLLGEVLASAEQYIDTTSINSPNRNTVRYVITGVDSKGNEEPIAMRKWHNTLFININKSTGSFSWAGTGYLIQNNSLPVVTYVLYRDDLSNGLWIPIDSVSGTQNTMTDPNYSSYPTGRWYVEARLDVSGCTTPTERVESGSSVGSRSNQEGNVLLGLQQLTNIAGSVSIYPNPVSQTLNIKFSQTRTKNTIIRIMDVTGRVIMNTSNVGAHDDISTINVSALSAGVYFIGISNAETQQTIKFVKE